MLATYLADTANLLNDAGSQFFSTPTLTSYVNRSRRRIAAASGCIRIVPEGTKTIPGQHIYSFHDWTALVQSTPGVREILAVRTLAVAIGPDPGAWKPVWFRIPWSDWQTRFGIWNNAYIGTISYPGVYSQYSFGVNGKLYLAPTPTQIQPIEVDCSCMPFALQTDDDPEALVYPWTDAVAYYAAFLCLLQQQRRDDAMAMRELFQAELPFAASVVSPTMVNNPYGASLRSA